MQLDIGTHTIIILTGPSQCGKSTWAKTFKNKVIEINNNLRTNIISSDEIRHEILGQQLHRYDPRMLEVSEAAFDLLFEKLKAATRFPVNNEFIIIDTTGLDENFREKVISIAKENNYRTAIVMFDYPTSDYFDSLSASDKKIVAKHVDTFKKKVLPKIKRKQFNYNFSIKGKTEKYFNNLDINIIDNDIWSKCHLFDSDINEHKPLAIIGDVHEHIEALQQLIKRIPNNSQLIFVGDLFDKGQKTIETLEYAEQLIAQGAIIVRGNHESFVARRLKGEIGRVDIEDEYFSSLKLFKQNKDLAERFLAIYEKTLPFLCVHTHGKTIYITHAPCYNKSLGKLDEQSQKFQRNFYFTSRKSHEMQQELNFIHEEAKYSHPLHIFGHVAHDLKEVIDKNKYWLDTGAVYGNKLTCLMVYTHGDTKLISQKTTALTEGVLLGTEKSKTKEEVMDVIEEATSEKEVTVHDKGNEDYIDLMMKKYSLTPEDKYWLHVFDESGAKFISGTMSPSRSTQNLLEPIDTALQYFKSKNISDVIIEPKYMGSRLQVYLHRDRKKDFAITRSGSKAGNKDILQPIFDKWHSMLDNDKRWKESIVLDGELLPWSSIGKELIEKEFEQYGKSIEKEWELLSSDKNFNMFSKNIGIDIPTEKKGIETFMKQLELYGSDYPIEYKPFSVLSVDNVLWTHKNQEEIFKWLMPNENYKVIHLDDEDALIQSQDFFKKLTLSLDEKGFAHEGVVVKPLIYQEGVAPYMKVRNENYLHLIYGYDYLKKYQEKVSNKKINKKLEMSIKEYEIGLKMLTSISREECLDLACQMKYQLKLEKELDPRL